jgi:hypothetical protein
MTLWEVRVARSDECRLEQKAGYSQHTSLQLASSGTLMISLEIAGRVAGLRKGYMANRSQALYGSGEASGQFLRQILGMWLANIIGPFRFM